MRNNNRVAQNETRVGSECRISGNILITPALVFSIQEKMFSVYRYFFFVHNLEELRFYFFFIASDFVSEQFVGGKD